MLAAGGEYPGGLDAPPTAVVQGYAVGSSNNEETTANERQHEQLPVAMALALPTHGMIHGTGVGEGHVAVGGGGGGGVGMMLMNQNGYIPGTQEVRADSAVAVPIFAMPMRALYGGPRPGVYPEGFIDELNDRERNLLDVYKLSRSIRSVCILDVAFLVIFGVFSPLFFLLIPFPLLGYIGARRFIVLPLQVYITYLFLDCLGGIVSLFLIPGWTFLVIRLLYVLLNLVISRYVIRLCSFISVFEDHDFDFLKNSRIIVAIERGVLC